MPYAIVPFKNGFKLKQLSSGKFMSKRPLTYEQAKKQAVASIRANSSWNLI